MQTPPPKVFVSSTWLDLEPERNAVEAAISRMRSSGFVGMEYFGSRDETPRQVSLDEVDRSHVYVGIFAARYGSGITEAEYRRARERGLTCKIYFKSAASITLDKFENDPAQQARLDALKAELRHAHTYTDFTTPDDLAKKVISDLHSWFIEEYLPRATPKAETAPAASALASLHQLPSPPRDFTGRKEELDELMREIERGGATISGLQGKGGVGKTTLALKLAEQLTGRFPDAQFYLDLKGTTQPLSPSDAMAHVIRAYHPTAKLPDKEDELRALYNSVLHHQRALLLMDNARDAAQVEPLIPPDPCVLLVTSRWHFHVPGLFAKDLDTLPPEDARALLTRIAPRIGEHAEETARLCGRLPLALRLAASALAERRDLSPADYVRRLSDEQQRLKLLDKVEVSLGVSYDLLTPDLQKLWRSLAVFPATFDARATAAVWEIEPDAAQDALGELVKYSLLDWDDTTTRYSLHDLARLLAGNRLRDEERYTAQARHAVHYLKVLDEADNLYKQGGEVLMRGLALFDVESANIRAGQSWAAQNVSKQSIVARICSDFAGAGVNLLSLRLNPRERINWLERALFAARGLNSRHVEATHLGNLGVAYGQIGELHRSLQLFEQELAIGREIDDRAAEGSALGNLGVIYRLMGDMPRSIEFIEMQLAIVRAMGNRRGERNALGNLGNNYHSLNEYKRAIEFYEQVLAIDNELGDQRSMSNALSNLGTSHASLGEFNRSIEFYKQALAMASKIGAREVESNALWGMSLVFERIGDYERAIARGERALEIYKQLEDPRVARVNELLVEWRRREE